MPSDSVAESESSVAANLFPVSGAKDAYSRRSKMWLGKEGTDSKGLGTQYQDANRELRHSAFLWEVSCHSIWSEGRDREGAYSRDRLNKTPPGLRGERLLWKFHLDFGQMLFSGSPKSGHTLVLGFLECTEITFGLWFPFQEEKASCFKATASLQV